MKNVLKKASNRELELKFRADDIQPQDFVAWCGSTGCMTSYRTVKSPDVYYRQGKNVLRFRGQPGGYGATITVKKRTSRRSTTNRLEIDVPVDESVSDEDLKAFLEQTGWEPELSIIKESHIIIIDDFVFSEELKGENRSPPVCLAFYTVWDNVDMTSPRSFLEVEVEKAYVDDRAPIFLELWRRCLTRVFGLPDPLNRSLYELFTGKRYEMVK